LFKTNIIGKYSNEYAGFHRKRDGRKPNENTAKLASGMAKRRKTRFKQSDAEVLQKRNKAQKKDIGCLKKEIFLVWKAIKMWSKVSY
jgi:hypothetical protein